MTDIHSGFQDIDRAREVQQFFAFLDEANELASIRSCRRRMLELCPVRSNDHILDVGCGLGHSALNLASMAGHSGSIVGLDKSEILITEARQRAQKRSASIDFRSGDACSLDFPDDRFDLCRAERMLMYLEFPERALDEMIRVLRPGGRFVLFEFDYDCIVIDAAEEGLTRRIARLVSDSVPSPWIGRRLPRFFNERGGENLMVLPHIVTTPLHMFRRVVSDTVSDAVARGEFDATQVDSWWRGLEQSDHCGRFFAGFFGFIISGRLSAAWRTKSEKG